MSHNKVYSRVPLGCCIYFALHQRSDQSVQSSPIVAHRKQVDAQREISIQYKKKKKRTQIEGQRFCFFFSFFLSFFPVLIYHESIYLKQTGPMSKPNS